MWRDLCKGVRYNDETGVIRCNDTEFAEGDVVYNRVVDSCNKIVVRVDPLRMRVTLKPYSPGAGNERPCTIEYFRDSYRLATERKRHAS